METSHIFIAHQIPSGACFGARSDSGEQVFIPASVAKASCAVEGQTRESKVIPNRHDNREMTPWVAVFVAKENSEGDLSVSEDHLLDGIRRAGYATTAELAKYVGRDVAPTQSALMQMLRESKVVKAEVYSKMRPAPPEMCLWALSINAFIE